MNEQKWYLCNLCKTVCPQLSSEHISGYCACYGEGTQMELLEESDPKIQSNEHYKEVMQSVNKEKKPMKKIMTMGWFTQMFLEEVKKIYADAELIDIRNSYIVKKDSLKEGKEITGEDKQVSLCGFRHKKITKGYTYKEYDVIFKFSIYKHDNRKGSDPVTYNVDLYTNKNFTCEQADTLSTTIEERIKKDQILDTVSFVLVRDADQEKIRFNERFTE